MATILAIFIYVTVFFSFVCSLYVAFKLYKNKINYLVGILSAATALIELVVLSSVIWIEDFEHQVPERYCVVQGLAIQYCAYLQMVSALCFSIHLYQLLVRKMERNSQTLHRIYMIFIVVVPILMTITVAIVSIRTNAVQPFEISCDIKNPMWVRLIGYSGFNLVATMIGAYFSIRAVFKVFRHLDQFKSQMTDRSNHIMTNNSTITNEDAESANVTNEPNETRVKTDFPRKIQRSYSLTRAAAMRMVLFSLGLTLVNILASIQTIVQLCEALKGGKDNSTGLRSADFAVAFTGIFIYIIFGIPNIKKRS